jgi:2-amino-4-hydroxy-6-hydroxymethyldihydropteridine diphosphokinase
VVDSPAFAYVGVGSNIRPEDNVRKALTALAETHGVTLTAISTFYRTAAIADPKDSILPPSPDRRDFDPDFLNGVLEIRTDLSTDALLQLFHEIEIGLGRQRPSEPYAPRTIDLDLLLFGRGQSGVSGPTWQEIGPKRYLAHNDIERRAFVAHPLLELAPNLVLPPHGIPLRALATVFDSPGGAAEADFTEDLRVRLLPA